ncbi:MAG TPA: HupE/UreJ family protein [Ferruginibacter sp.]|nr:HupE/UreJ family protein [Ferruginibacter sp.]
MSDFRLFFSLGWSHIISWDALDHLLFILALSAIYLFRDWKQVLILITAFTIGHSLTLLLSVLDVIRFSSRWVEFLIPLTIVITASWNLLPKQKERPAIRIQYFLALGFGLIHGMGFANSIRFMMAESQSIAVPLLSFNIGLEAGQIVVVTGILLLAQVLVVSARLPRILWIRSTAWIALGISAWMCYERFPIG